MAQFSKSQDMGGIQEERGFTNPHVRFVRIRGKIVPIVNKKRIGQDLSSSGESLVLKGSSLAAVSYLLKKALVPKDFNGFKTKIPGFLKVSTSDGFKARIVKHTISGTAKAFKFAGKNSGKIGLSLAGLGVISKIAGDTMQVNSGFGKDFFFTKDDQGRDS